MIDIMLIKRDDLNNKRETIYYANKITKFIINKRKVKIVAETVFSEPKTIKINFELEKDKNWLVIFCNPKISFQINDDIASYVSCLIIKTDGKRTSGVEKYMTTCGMESHNLWDDKEKNPIKIKQL